MKTIPLFTSQTSQNITIPACKTPDLSLSESKQLEASAAELMAGLTSKSSPTIQEYLAQTIPLTVFKESLKNNNDNSLYQLEKNLMRIIIQRFSSQKFIDSSSLLIMLKHFLKNDWNFKENDQFFTNSENSLKPSMSIFDFKECIAPNLWRLLVAQCSREEKNQLKALMPISLSSSPSSLFFFKSTNSNAFTAEDKKPVKEFSGMK